MRCLSSEGRVDRGGLEASDPSAVWKLRRKCGMVFQNPDNQFVSSVVAEDIAFGLRITAPAGGHPAPGEEATAGGDGRGRKTIHIHAVRRAKTVALAGVWLRCRSYHFRQATVMLDGREQEVMETIRRLHAQEHKTIILISHYMEDVLMPTNIMAGKIRRRAAAEMLTDLSLLAAAGPSALAVQVYYDLLAAGGAGPLSMTEEELVEICRLF